MKDRIQTAFMEIHADDALINSTKVYLRGEAEKRRHKSKRVRLPARIGAMAAMAMLAVGIFSYNLYFTAAAHVSIDVNPSVELTLNRFDRIIDTCAFNEDGARILNEVSLRGKKYNEAATLVLSVIEASGYIAEDTLISVTIQTANDEKEQILCDALLQFINEKIIPVQASADIEVFPVTAEVWSSAHGCHLSPAKYMAIQELMEEDETATIEDYSDTSIRQIRQRTQVCRNKHNTESNGNGSESGPQNRQGHGQGGDHGCGGRY